VRPHPWTVQLTTGAGHPARTVSRHHTRATARINAWWRDLTAIHLHGSGAAFYTYRVVPHQPPRTTPDCGAVLTPYDTPCGQPAGHVGAHTIGPTEQDKVNDAFEFARALSDSRIRTELARRGFASGARIVVGRDTPTAGFHEQPTFRVWRDTTVPGGWTGEPVQ
jgi:hypothetical protein